jgi:hypothetical protein
MSKHAAYKLLLGIHITKIEEKKSVKSLRALSYSLQYSPQVKKITAYLLEATGETCIAILMKELENVQLSSSNHQLCRIEIAPFYRWSNTKEEAGEGNDCTSVDELNLEEPVNLEKDFICKKNVARDTMSFICPDSFSQGLYVVFVATGIPNC